MRSSFRIYKTKSDLCVVGNEIESIEYHFGCDGDKHAICICKLYMDSRGKTQNAKHIGDVVVGKCDDSCLRPDIGGFLMDE